MKRLLFIITSIVLFSSCGFDDGSGTTSQYQVNVHFQYSPMPSFSPDSTFFNTVTAEGFGFENLVNFYHQLDGDKTWFDGGFLLSRLEMPKSGVTEGLKNAYRSYVKNGKGLSGNVYAVYYQNPDPALMPAHDFNFPFKENGSCVMKGCFITNTVETADFIAENFKLGDRMTVKATGWLDDKPTDSAEFVLADFSAQKDSIVSRWTPFDLTKLGSVEYVEFEIASTVPETPAYFCMDNLQVDITLQY